jgi:hypothetical protein
MPEAAGDQRVRYRFSPLERRGVIAGWRGGQIASVAASLVVAVLALRSRPSLGGIALAVATVGVGVALAFWPVFGRTGEQWLPLLVRWGWAATGGTRRQASPGPRAGHEAAVDLDGPGQPSVRVRSSPPRRRTGGRPMAFDGLSLIGARFDGTGASVPEAGVILDGPARTATAVLAVRGHSFALLGPRDQDSRIAAWARVLSAMAREGSEVHRLQWVETCRPDDGSAVRQHCDEHAVLGTEAASGRSYRALVDQSAPVTRRHQVLLALSIHSARSSRTIRASGGGAAGTAAVLAREVLSLHRALEGADLTVDGVLGPAALSRIIREASSAPGPSPSLPTGPAGWPWPMAVEPEWDAVRTDGTWHATYWIAEWPQVDVAPDFLGPLLFSPLRRSISLIMEPVSPSRAARQVAQARTADLADGELRRRGGFLVTARHTRERESVEDRDAELADGHAQFRFTGYVTVTAATRDELDRARAVVEQAAGQARLELRLLYGEQAVAFACSLPLGRGLS